MDACVPGLAAWRRKPQRETELERKKEIGGSERKKERKKERAGKIFTGGRDCLL